MTLSNPAKFPLRTVRSFVRRTGRITCAQEEAIRHFWPLYGVQLAEKIDLNALFQRSAPTILEIGFGMGQSLLKQAVENPDKNYIGIEVHKPGVGNLLVGVEQHQLSNVRIFMADAIQVLQLAIPDASLAAIQIFFPDPWPKRRHQKRRLIQDEFITLISQKLQSNGQLFLATDWEDYAKHMMSVLSRAQHLTNLAGEEKFSARPEERPLTKYELRGQRLGHGVWDLIFQKQS